MFFSLKIKENQYKKNQSLFIITFMILYFIIHYYYYQNLLKLFFIQFIHTHHESIRIH